MFLQVAQQVHHLRLDRDVERAGGLVGDDQARAHREHARDAHAALLASGELRGKVRQLAALEIHLLEQLADAPRDLGVARALVNGERLAQDGVRSEEHTSELQSLTNLVCRLLLEKKKKKNRY